MDLVLVGVCVALIVLTLIGVIVPADSLRQTLVIVLSAFVAIRRFLAFLSRRRSG